MTSRAKPRFIFAFAGWAALAAGLAPACGHVHEAPPPPAAVPATKPDHEHGVETGLTVSSTPQGLMREGAEARIQERLRAKELLPAGHRTGQLDADTRDALRRYQERAGLPATGLPSYETIRSLGLPLDTIFLAIEPRSGRDSGRSGAGGGGVVPTPAAGAPARRAE
ncbi:MAG TPA: peptidoglycan-binding domain-containing protein [Polyangia bacterium]